MKERSIKKSGASGRLPTSPPTVLIIPDVPPSLNKVLRMHWTSKLALKNDWILYIRSKFVGVPEFPGCVTVQRVRCKITLCHARPYDQDNAYGAVKPLVDALKNLQLIVDDSPANLELTVGQERCPHKKRHTVIELEAA